MEYPVSLGTVILPSASAKIFVDPNLTWHSGPRCKIRKDQGQVPRLGNHGVVPISIALATAPWVHVDISNDHHLQSPTFLPYQPELRAVKLYNALVKAGWIDVVIVEELAYPPGIALDGSEQKGAAFTPTTCAPPKFVDAFIPDLPITDQLRRPAYHRA